MKGTQKYTIKEVAQLSGLTVSTLRYYETIGLIDQIGRDPSSKHRTYNEDELNFVIAVACLNATGMSLDEMREYLNNRHHGSKAAGQQIALLETQGARLAKEAQHIKLRRRYVDIKIEYWKAVEAKSAKEIETAAQNARAIAKEMQTPKKTK